VKIGIREAALMSRDTIKPRPTPTPKIPELKVITASEIPTFPGVTFIRMEKLENKLIKRIVPKGKVTSERARKATQNNNPFNRMISSVKHESLTKRRQSLFIRF
jgi:hypothetical protein